MSDLGLLIILLLIFVLFISISNVSARVRNLELRLGSAEPGLRDVRRAPEEEVQPVAPAQTPATQVPATPVEPIPATPLEPTPQATASTASPDQAQAAPQPVVQSDLERTIAGNWLNRIGILALLISAAFFIKFAIDHNWIGPFARAVLGLAAGSAIVAASSPLFRRGYVFFSEGVVALGAGVLYLTLYAGWGQHLFPLLATFAGMAIVTMVILLMAIGRNSERLAFLSLLAGFLTPLLLNTRTSAEVSLFTYLAVLNAGLLIVAHVRQWRSLPFAFIFTLFYAFAWYQDYYNAANLLPTLVFFTIFYLEFAALPFLYARTTGGLRPEHLPLVVLNAGLYAIALSGMLYAEHRWLLTAWLVALAIVHFGASRLTAKAEGAPIARYTYEALAFAFVAIAIAVRLKAQWITIGWSVEAAALALSGVRANSRMLRVDALLLFAAAVLRLLATPYEATRFLFNADCGTYALVIACLGAAAYDALARREMIGRAETVAFKTAAVTANLLALVALSRELANLQVDAQTQQFATIILWSAYAAALGFIGAARRSGLIAWQAPLLLLVAVGSFFTTDLRPVFYQWTVMVWAAQSALLVWIGLEWHSKISRVIGLVLLAFTALALYNGVGNGEIAGERFVFNARFGLFAYLIACLAFGVYAAYDRRATLSSGEYTTYRVFGVGINVLAVTALSFEVWNLGSTFEQHQLSLTIVWTLYAAGLMLVGLRRGSALLRWQSLTLLGLVIAKVFIFDLSVLPLGFRVLSFFALGTVLLAVSFMYQRRLVPRL